MDGFNSIKICRCRFLCQALLSCYEVKTGEAHCIIFLKSQSKTEARKKDPSLPLLFWSLHRRDKEASLVRTAVKSASRFCPILSYMSPQSIVRSYPVVVFLHLCTDKRKHQKVNVLVSFTFIVHEEKGGKTHRCMNL